MTDFASLVVCTAIGIGIFIKVCLPELKAKQKKSFILCSVFIAGGYTIFILLFIGIEVMSPLNLVENIIRNAFNIH